MSYFNKHNFDENEKHVKAYDFHYLTKFALVLNGVFFNNRESHIRHFLPLLWASYSFSCIVILAFHVYHSYKVNNIPEFSETLVYILLSNVLVIHETLMTMHFRKVDNIIDLIEIDFAEMDFLTDEHRKVFYSNQKIIWKYSLIWYIIMMFTSAMFWVKTIVAILHQYLFLETAEGQQRPLMFKLWLPYDDVYRTPVYETFLVVQFSIVTVVAIVLGSFIGMQMQFFGHAMGQLDLIVLDFNNLFEIEELQTEENEITPSVIRNEIRKRISIIVKRHDKIYKFCDSANSLFGPTLFYQTLVGPVDICITGFQILESLSNDVLPVQFITLFCAVIAEIFFPCYIGSKLTEKGYAVRDACYACKWETYKENVAIRKEIQIFTMRADRELNVNSFGLCSVTLATFSTILKTSGSYFTMLRQLNDNS